MVQQVETEQFVADLIQHTVASTTSSLSRRGPQYTQHQKLLEMNFLIFKWEERSAVSIGRRVQDPL